MGISPFNSTIQSLMNMGQMPQQGINPQLASVNPVQELPQLPQAPMSPGGSPVDMYGTQRTPLSQVLRGSLASMQRDPLSELMMQYDTLGWY